MLFGIIFIDTRLYSDYSIPDEFETRIVTGNMETLGKRIRELRQKKGWPQQQLAEKVGVRQKQISSYERDINVPAGELLIALAEEFDVSLDYLAKRSNGNTAQIAIADMDLLHKVQSIDQLPEEDRSLVKGIMDLVLLKHRFKKIVDETVTPSTN